LAPYGGQRAPFRVTFAPIVQTSSYATAYKSSEKEAALGLH